MEVGHPYGKPHRHLGDKGGPGKWEWRADNINKYHLEKGNTLSRVPAPLPEAKKIVKKEAEIVGKIAKTAEAGEGLAKKLGDALGGKAAKFAPGVGSVIGIYQGIENFREGNYIEGMLDIGGVIPGPVGDAFDIIGIGYTVGKIVVTEFGESESAKPREVEEAKRLKPGIADLLERLLPKAPPEPKPAPGPVPSPSPIRVPPPAPTPLPPPRPPPAPVPKDFPAA
jgi:hypothetical protein